MKQAFVCEVVTPKKIFLNGLWFGPKKPKRTVVWVHGLASSAFSKLDIVEKLVDAETAVLTFNNRGSGSVARLNSLGKKKTLAGAAYERFEDCVDDIQGAVNFARSRGTRDIYIAGHSTGCQKAVYWANQKSAKGVRGLVLLAPASDYAGAVHKYGLPKIRSLAALSRALIKSGKGDDLLPKKSWSEEPDSPRRFLSLYTSDSVEQSIFPYFDPKRPAKYLQKMRTPVLVVWAQKDEFADRSAHEIVAWFRAKSPRSLETIVARNAPHSFKGLEKEVAGAIKKWISARK